MVYHGTTLKNANSIVSEKNIKQSIGDRHWLGDGVYFYEELLYAVRWIRCKEKSDELFKKYAIISAELNINEERVFSFFKYEHKLLFKEVIKICHRRLMEINQAVAVVDGTVLNIMFKKMKYGKEYDAVRAMFIHEDKEMEQYESRLYYVPEIQICVKNISVIKRLEKLEEIEEKCKKYISIADEFTVKASGVLGTKDMKYRRRKEKRYRS